MSKRKDPNTNDAVVRAQQAPRTARGARRVDPFLVIVGTAVFIVGFFVTRGLAAPTRVPSNSTSASTGYTRLQPAATLPPTTPQPVISGAPGTMPPHAYNDTTSSNNGNFIDQHVPVDSQTMQTIVNGVAANQQRLAQSTNATSETSSAQTHTLVDVPVNSVQSPDMGVQQQTAQLAAEGAQLRRQVAQFQSGTAQEEPTAMPSASPTPASVAVGGQIPGAMPGTFSTPAPYELPAGWAIEVQSSFALDSDLSGDVNAVALRDKCDPRNGAVVVPRGTTFQGKYVGLDSHRHLLFAWYRATQPDLTYRMLSYMQTVDEEGHAGIGGHIASNRWALFRDTIVGSIATAAGNIIDSAVSRGTHVQVDNSASNYAPTEDVPSVQIGQATPFNIYLEADYTVDKPYHGEYCR